MRPPYYDQQQQQATAAAAAAAVSYMPQQYQPNAVQQMPQRFPPPAVRTPVPLAATPGPVALPPQAQAPLPLAAPGPSQQYGYVLPQVMYYSQQQHQQQLQGGYPQQQQHQQQPQHAYAQQQQPVRPLAQPPQQPSYYAGDQQSTAGYFQYPAGAHIIQRFRWHSRPSDVHAVPAGWRASCATPRHSNWMAAAELPCRPFGRRRLSASATAAGGTTDRPDRGTCAINACNKVSCL